MKKKQLLAYSIFAIFCIVLITYHLIGYIGHYGYDDLHYAKLSSDFINGKLDYNDHFTFRFPIIFLTSLFYSLFGISDFSSSLPALILSMLILYFVFLILKNKNSKTLILGLFLTTFSNWFIFYSDKLMPDIYIAFSVIATLAVIYKYKYKTNKKQPILFSFLFTFSLLFGFMAKGTIILILPLLVYYFVIDILFKRDLEFWKYNIIIGFILFTLYFFIIWLLTGDFLKRFDAITSNSYLNLCSYDAQSIAILIRRITYEFFTMLIYQAMVTGFIFILAVFLRKKSLHYFKFNDPVSFFITSSAILLLSSNFMSISLTSYSPMCIDPRHYLFLIPIVSIPASTIITEFIEEKRYKIQILLGLILVSVLSFFLQGNTFGQLYFPLTILFSLYLLFKTKPIYQSFFITLFVIVLIIKPLNMIIYGQKIKYWKQKEIFSNYILDREEDCIVITNDVQKRLATYYTKFDTNNSIKFMNYSEFQIDSTNIKKKILFLNWYTRYLSNMDFNDLPYFAKNISPSNKLIYENKDLNISIYEMIDFSIPEISGNTLLYSLNTFEKPVKNWNQNNENISNEIKYAGEKSIQVIEFSSTFEYPLDSFQIGSYENVLIRCHLYCNFKDKTAAKIVISIENNEGVYIWEGMEINKYLKAYSNWWPIKCEVKIDCKKLKNDSRLKVYIWNINKETAYIDNFEIEIIEINN